MRGRRNSTGTFPRDRFLSAPRNATRLPKCRSRCSCTRTRSQPLKCSICRCGQLHRLSSAIRPPRLGIRFVPVKGAAKVKAQHARTLRHRAEQCLNHPCHASTPGIRLQLEPLQGPESGRVEATGQFLRHCFRHGGRGCIDLKAADAGPVASGKRRHGSARRPKQLSSKDSMSHIDPEADATRSRKASLASNSSPSGSWQPKLALYITMPCSAVQVERDPLSGLWAGSHEIDFHRVQEVTVTAGYHYCLRSSTLETSGMVRAGFQSIVNSTKVLLYCNHKHNVRCDSKNQAFPNQKTMSHVSKSRILCGTSSSICS